MHPSTDQNHTNISCIHSKSNLIQLFSQATFPQCYHIRSKSKYWVNSDGLDFFPIKQSELVVMKTTTCIYPLTRSAREIPLFLSNRIFWNFSQKPYFHIGITYGQNPTNCAISDGLDFFPIKELELVVTESTTCIHPLTRNARKINLSLPIRIFWNFPEKPYFHIGITYGQNPTNCAISDGLDILPFKQLELVVTESTTRIHPLTSTARKFSISL